MGELRKKIKSQGLGTAVCLGILLLASSGCKNTTTPDANEKPRIMVRNNLGIDVDVYMDGVYQSDLGYKEYFYIENVTLGTHLLEAKKKGTALLLKSVSAEITDSSGMVWTINSEAVVTITNNYGETLSLYGDGTYQTDIDNQGSASIQQIPYGEHLFEAKRPNESQVLASTRIEIIEDKQYLWTITK